MVQGFVPVAVVFPDCSVLSPQVWQWPAPWWTFHSRCQLPTKRNQAQYGTANSSPLHSQEPVFDAWTSETVLNKTEKEYPRGGRGEEIPKLCRKRLEALKSPHEKHHHNFLAPNSHLRDSWLVWQLLPRAVLTPGFRWLLQSAGLQ